MLCCKFNVNFQNVKPPYTNVNTPIEYFRRFCRGPNFKWLYGGVFAL